MTRTGYKLTFREKLMAWISFTAILALFEVPRYWSRLAR